MSTKPTQAEMKTIFDPFVEKHFSKTEVEDLAKQPFDQEKVARSWDAIIAEAKRLMAIGDPGSPAALALARRWKAQIEEFTKGDPGMNQRVKAVWDDAMADPKAAPKLPLNPEIFGFMGQAMAKLKESGG